MPRLWDKGDDLDAVVHRFTVGDDPRLDRALVRWDCLGSAAHARTLAKAGLLSEAEATALVAELRRIDDDARQGQFDIPDDLEDCHTAIEARLTRTLGEVGEKIHAGRSRNDQVAAAMRLYMRSHVLDILDALVSFANTLLDRMVLDGSVDMPGYTHLRPAMPSSVGQWLHAFVEAALEQMRAALDLFDRLDCCPLGTGAGFGVPLPLDREYTAKLLGFSRVQRSPIDVQNSRGRMETYFVRVAVDVGALLEKLCCDLALFTMSEFGYFSLPAAMTTGSSLMPQKKNPDVIELMRARAGRLRGRLHELEWITGKLPSNYHRDLQLTKAPVLAAAGDIEEMLAVADRLVAGLVIHTDRLRAAMTPELYATHAVLLLVQESVPFRQAYQRIAGDIASRTFEPPSRERGPLTSPLVPAALIDELRAEVAARAQSGRDLHHRIISAQTALLPQ